MRLAAPTTADQTERAQTDSLTGLHDWRAFESRLRDATAEAARGGRPLSLIIIGIDDFTNLQRRLGTSTTNACVQIVVETMTRAVQRVGMFMARLAHGQFGMILPCTDEQSVQLLAGHLVHCVRSLGLRHPSRPDSLVTVSAGIATSNGHWDIDGQALWVIADQALHHAAQSGGDRTATVAELETH